MKKLIALASLVLGIFTFETASAAPYMNFCADTTVSGGSAGACVDMRGYNDIGNKGVVVGNEYFGSDQWELLATFDDDGLSSAFNVALSATLDTDRGTFSFDASQATISFSRLMLSLKAGKSFALYHLFLAPDQPGTYTFSGNFSGIGKGLSHISLFGDTNVATVPLPAAAWVFGPAVIGLIGLSRRRKKQK